MEHSHHTLSWRRQYLYSHILEPASALEGVILHLCDAVVAQIQLLQLRQSGEETGWYTADGVVTKNPAGVTDSS